MSGPTTGSAEIADIVTGIVVSVVQPLGVSVARARAFNLQSDQLPAALVYAWEEDFREKSISSEATRYEVTCQMVVSIAASGTTPVEVEATLNSLIGPVRRAIIQSPVLCADGGAIEHILSVKTKIEIPDQKGESFLGQANLTLEMQWSELYEVPLDQLPGGSGFPLCDPMGFGFELPAGALGTAAP